MNDERNTTKNNEEDKDRRNPPNPMMHDDNKNNDNDNDVHRQSSVRNTSSASSSRYVPSMIRRMEADLLAKEETVNMPTDTDNSKLRKQSSSKSSSQQQQEQQQEKSIEESEEEKKDMMRRTGNSASRIAMAAIEAQVENNARNIQQRKKQDRMNASNHDSSSSLGSTGNPSQSGTSSQTNKPSEPKANLMRRTGDSASRIAMAAIEAQVENNSRNSQPKKQISGEDRPSDHHHLHHHHHSHATSAMKAMEDDVRQKMLAMQGKGRDDTKIPKGSGHRAHSVALDLMEQDMADKVRNSSVIRGSIVSAAMNDMEDMTVSERFDEQLVDKQQVYENVAYGFQESGTTPGDAEDGDATASGVDYAGDDDESADGAAIPRGAFHVAPSGIVISREPGILSNQPHQLSHRNHEQQQGQQGQQQRENADIEARVDAVPSSLEEKPDEEATVCSKRSLTILVCVILTVVAVVVAVLVVLGGDDSTAIVSEQPSQSPTEIPLGDPERIAAARDILEGTVSSREAFDDRSSPQFSAIVWLSEDELSVIDSVSAVGSDLQKFVTRYVLAVFYYILNGTFWISKEGWLDSEVDECTWEYIVCDERGSVVGIDTGGGDKNMRGLLPSELQHIASLRDVLLPENAVTGFVGYIGDIASLDLTGNGISGTLPDFLYDMTSLETIALQGNSFEGSISSAIGKLSNLRTLNLQDNLLSGSVPTNLSSLTLLEVLSLSSNLLSGAFHEIFKGLPYLKTLRINDNNLSGSIGTEVATMTSLERLAASANLLEGSIPTEIGFLSNLLFLGLGQNRLLGTIPTDIGVVSRLRDLRLYQNFFTGLFPTEIGHMTRLTDLRGYSNTFAGPIPSTLENLRRLSRIDLSMNLFNGTIPEGVAASNQLGLLKLNSNSLEGTVPLSIGSLNFLEILRLDGNPELTGTIPMALCGRPRITQIVVPCHVECNCAQCDCRQRK